MIAIIFILPAPVFAGYDYPLIFPYNWHKVLHILGAVLFLGNIIVTGLWMAWAEQTKNASVLRFASKVVNWADVIFTAPGIILLLWNGLTLSKTWGGALETSWIMIALGLFGASGIVWLAFLVPDQHRLIKISHSQLNADILPPEFYSTLHGWYFWGIVATILPLISLAFMVLKPEL